MNWVTKVAWHEVQSEWNRQARTIPTELSQIPARDDPATTIQGSLDLDTIKLGLAELSNSERDAILSALEDRPAIGGPLEPRIKMRRSRARQRLARITGLLNEELD